MRLLAWCSLAACVAQIAGKVDVKVVGGQPVPSGSSDFLWAASLQDAQGRHFCGGTLVAPGWVVTAAHCVFQKAAPAQVVLGAVMLGDSNAVRRSVQSVVVHDQYNSATMRFDVALLQLSTEVTSVAPLSLIDSGSQENSGSSAGLVGWGSTRSYGGMVSQLNFASVPIQTYAACTAPGALPASGVFNDVNICAGFTSGGVDTCSGDSGGPLFSSNPRRLIGITSWGQGCGLPKKYGVYTRVSAIKSWITSRTAGAAPVARPTVRAPGTSLAVEEAFCRKFSRVLCALQSSRCFWAGSACATPLTSDPAFSRAPTAPPSATARPTRRPTPQPTPFPTRFPTTPDYSSSGDPCAGKTKRECKAASSCEWDSGSKTCYSEDPEYD
jgi:secreted trypsin-like serine protease